MEGYEHLVAQLIERWPDQARVGKSALAAELLVLDMSADADELGINADENALDALEALELLAEEEAAEIAGAFGDTMTADEVMDRMNDLFGEDSW